MVEQGPWMGLCWPVNPVCAQAEWDAFEQPVREYAAQQAVETLRMLTGYRVGNCPITVRPCSKTCGEASTWAVFPAGGGGSGTAPVVGWQPAMASGQWINLACGCRNSDCSCTTVSEIPLPTTVSAIVEVTLDGTVLDPSAYRVDNHHRLVRLDGGVWPLCQDMNAPLTGEGSENTLGVSYVTGSLPGPTGAGAAGRLAVEYARACVGDDCALPTGATSIARAGLSITVATGAFPGGLTGIREVDAFIQRHNPNHLKGASTVWSPDTKHPRRTTLGG